MSESAPEPPASPDPGQAGTSPGVDRGAPAAPGPDPFAAERAQLTASSREWQSRYDRATAELEQARSRLQEYEATPAAPPEPAYRNGPSAMSPHQLEAVLDRREARISLREQFPQADERVFDDYRQYGSVEAFKVAAEQSHERNVARDAAVREQLLGELRAQGVQVPGAPPPADPQIPAPTGLTLESYLAMPLSEQLKVPREEVRAITGL